MNPSHCSAAPQALDFLRSLNLAMAADEPVPSSAPDFPSILGDLVLRAGWRSYALWTHDQRLERLTRVQAWPTDLGSGLLEDEVLDHGARVVEEPGSGGLATIAVAIEVGRSTPAVVVFGLPWPVAQVSGELVEIVGETGRGALAHLYLAGGLEPPTHPLTTREYDVLRWAGQGFGVVEIADLLEVQPSTVKTHLEHIYLKLGVSDRAAAVAHGFRTGLLR